MKSLIIIASSMFLHGCATMAINPTVKGSVTDIDGNPVKATITIENYKTTNHPLTTITNNEGKYIIKKKHVFILFNVFQGIPDSTITYESPGFETVTHEIRDYSGYKSIVKDITMKKTNTPYKSFNPRL